MTRHAIATSGAPGAIGPYSQAIAIDGLLFCSGQLGLDPATGILVEGGVEAQAERSLRNLTAVLDAAGLVWVDVVKTTIFLADCIRGQQLATSGMSGNTKRPMLHFEVRKDATPVNPMTFLD